MLEVAAGLAAVLMAFAVGYMAGRTRERERWDERMKDLERRTR